MPYTKCSANGFMEKKSKKFYQGAQMTVSTPSLITKLDHCFWNAIDVKTLEVFVSKLSINICIIAYKLFQCHKRMIRNVLLMVKLWSMISQI